MILLLKLFLAHLIGDFLLQPDTWVKAKEEKKLGSYHLYLHALLHGLLIMLLVWEKDFIKWAVLIAGIHLMIDTGKILLQKEGTKRLFFFADQTLHLISLLILYLWLESPVIKFDFLSNEKILVLASCVILLTLPSSIVIKLLLAGWTPEDNNKESLKNAGKYIGMLERLFVFIFIITNHWEAVGFLLAAKSVFRFGDLKEAKDRKLTEYILIGTLLSFGVAIFTGMVCSMFL